MLFDFTTKITQLSLQIRRPQGGSVYAGMSVRVILKKVAQFAQELLAHFAQE
jgi:hypothetical protein